MPADLEHLYRDAKIALKARDYDRAGELLRQILLVDENYRDASRLLAQAVKLRRRRWYGDARVWTLIGVALVVASVFWLAPRFPRAAPSAAATQTAAPTATPLPTETGAPVATLTATPIPLTWKRLSLGQEFPRDTIESFEVDPNDPAVLYVRMQHAGYYQSIDGGVSWQPTNANAIPEFMLGRLPSAPTGAVTVTNRGADGKPRWYSNSRGGGHWSISQDGGASWREFATIGTPRSSAIEFDAEGAVYAYCNGYLCKYDANGTGKVTLGSPDVGAFSEIEISPSRPETIYIAGTGLAVSKDGGLTWQKLNDGLGATLLTIAADRSDASSLYLETGLCADTELAYNSQWSRREEPGQPLFVSNDGGRTWESSIETGCHLSQGAGSTIYRIGRGVDFASGNDSGRGWIWRSGDRAKSWQKIHTPIPGDTLAADPSRPGLLYLYRNQPWTEFSGQQYVSEDDGITWKQPERSRGSIMAGLCHGGAASFIDSYRPTAIDPRDGNHVFVVEKRALYESRDGCGLANRAPRTPSAKLNSIAFDARGRLYAATDAGVYMSFDSGQPWTLVNRGLLGVDVVYSVGVGQDGNVYAATPYGIFVLQEE